MPKLVHAAVEGVLAEKALIRKVKLFAAPIPIRDADGKRCGEDAARQPGNGGDVLGSGSESIGLGMAGEQILAGRGIEVGDTGSERGGNARRGLFGRGSRRDETGASDRAGNNPLHTQPPLPREL